MLPPPQQMLLHHRPGAAATTFLPSFLIKSPDVVMNYSLLMHLSRLGSSKADRPSKFTVVFFYELEILVSWKVGELHVDASYVTRAS